MNGVSLHVFAVLTLPNPVCTSASSPFEELGVLVARTRVFAGRGVVALLHIQVRTISDALDGCDLLGRAETGSGKTLVFGLLMLVCVAAARSVATSSAARSRRFWPLALVLVPTREL